MAFYPEGSISPSGKYIVKGGQWVPHVGTLPPPIQGPPAPTAPTPAAPAQVPPETQLSAPQPTEIEQSMAALHPSLGKRVLGAVAPYAGPAIEKGLQVLDLPHKYISQPIASALAKYMPEGTFPVPPVTGEAGAGLEQEPVDFNIKQAVEEGLPYALDYPIYGAAGKVLGGGLKLANQGIKRGLEAAAPALRKLQGIEAYQPTTIASKFKPAVTPPAAKDLGLDVPTWMREQANKAAPDLARGKWTYGAEGTAGKGEELGPWASRATPQWTPGATIEPPVGGAAEGVTEPLSRMDPDVESSAKALLNQLTGAGGVAGEIVGPPVEGALKEAAAPVARGPWAKGGSPLIDRLQQEQRLAGRRQYLETLPRFAAPGRAQTPAAIPRERWGTETAAAQRGFDKMQRAMQEIDRMKASLGVQ